MRESTHQGNPLIPVHHKSRPGHPVALFQNQMNRLFDNFLIHWSHPAAFTANLALPAIDVIENIKYFEVRAKLPGLEANDVEITASDGFLTIKGERKEEKEEKDQNYIRSETSYGSFQRTVALPETADADNVSKASFANGILTIMIPKKGESFGKSKKLPTKNAKKETRQ